MRKETYECIQRGYAEAILRELKGLRYFDDAEVLYYWHETVNGINNLKKQQVVNLVQMRRLAIGLVAIEATVKQRREGIR